MLCCGFSTARLRKFFKFRGLVVAFLVAFSIILLLKSGIVPTYSSHGTEHDLEIFWQDSSGRSNDASASGSGHHTKKMEPQTTKPLQLSNTETLSAHKENEIVLTTEGKEYYLETTHKSYLELIDETNPSHSLEHDKQHSLDKLKRFTQNMNEELLILNKDKFPKRPKHGPVVVVQVHKRLEYLVHLISSLEKAKGINDVLVIISSDWYSDAIVNAVKQIKFCQVYLQLISL